jgi:TRAP transporter TAXI family solute receptor
MGIRIGTSERGGTFNSQGLALGAVLEREPSLRPVEVLASNSASIENANRLHDGEIEFGFMAANWIGRALHGEAPFTQAIELKMVAPMNAGPLFFIARATSALRRVGDLRGKRVAVGLKTSGMVQHAMNIFRVLGLSLADLSPAYVDFAAGAEALAAGEVDAQFQCPIPNTVMTELASRLDLRVLAYEPGQIDALVETFPTYRPTLMRRGAIRGLDVEIPQIAVLNVLVTHASVLPALVREVTKAIVSSADELSRLNPLFSGLSDLFQPLRSQGAAALEFDGVALHPGALEAYRMAGLLS